MEPIQGEGGVRVGTQEFLQKARELCDASGALLVFDEVQCGVGRTGRLWGHEHVNVIPDVLTCAKALGGGVPIGAMLCADKANVFAPGDHATTYGGNPLACAAALAVARAVDDDGLVANAAARGAQLEAGLRAMGDKYAGKITEVRGRGLLLGLELSSELGARRSSSRPPRTAGSCSCRPARTSCASCRRSSSRPSRSTPRSGSSRSASPRPEVTYSRYYSAPPR